MSLSSMLQSLQEVLPTSSQASLESWSLFLSVVYALLGLLLLVARRGSRLVEERGHLVGVVLFVLAGTVALPFAPEPAALLPAGLIAITMQALVARLARGFRVTWHVFLTAMLLGVLVLAQWAFMLSAPTASVLPSFFVAVLRALLIATVLLGGVVLFCGSTCRFLPLFRRHRQRPVEPLEPKHGFPYPRVSIHVPCYSEPPDVVIATLDAISRLDYPNFEVLVIDNNTEDPALWQPVERHCQLLGERFRFFHVAPLKGAKGGALNFALRETDPSAQIISSIDADYQCEPDFLSWLVGFFENPRIAYVQTPHDYRDFETGSFQQSCFGEYREKQFLDYPGMNEWDASLIQGTMCLVRKTALEEVGQWSEECLSEDSELSLRLGAAGYEGQYVCRTFGRGLIPETLHEYQKQRFRWAAGTLQQVKMHWRAFMPAIFGWGSKMPAKKRLVTMCYRLGNVIDPLVYLLLSLSVVHAVVLHVNAESPPLSPYLALFLGASVGLRVVFSRLRSHYLNRSLGDTIRAFIAHASLCHVRVTAFVNICIPGRKLAWRRTSKFKASSEGWGSLRGVLPELGLGLVSLTLGVVLLSLSAWPVDVLFLNAVFTLAQSVIWLCAPVMALLQELDLRRAQRTRAIASAPDLLQKSA